MQFHRSHALAYFEAGGVAQAEVEVQVHYLVLLHLVVALNRRFVALDGLLPLFGGASEGRNGLSEEGVVCSLLG